MLKKRLIAVAVAGALSLLTSPLVVGAGIDNSAAEVIAVGADPLLAVESNRSGIIERLVVEHRSALSGAGISEGNFREALHALRADELLAASLVNNLAGVTAIITTPPVAGSVVSRFVAVTPTSTLAALPAADGYLVREGDSLSVVKAAQLQLNANTQLVGYFVSGSGTTISPKDGSGSGPNSWIGYTAGSNLASGTGSAVAAGTFNAASNTNAAVFAGQSNAASGISSLVIGGFDNRATAIDSLVGAGAGNRATGVRSVVIGGGYNLASGQWSFVGGGGRQSASGAGAGGFVEDNVAAGNFSVVAGGQANRATGPYATVPGGNANTAGGSSSFAAGNRAKATNNGAVAFADGSAFDFTTIANNEFAVRATGGVRLVTAIDGAGAPTNGMTLDGTGNLAVSGNIALADSTSASVGNITKGGASFLHNFGTNNTFIGKNAGNFTMTGGGNNVASGASALQNNTTGNHNTANGAFVLLANTTGNNNTAGGANAMQNNTAGCCNTALGQAALFANVSGSVNTAIGGSALQNNTFGGGNTAVGQAALMSNTTASGNTAVGQTALQNNTTGNANTANGQSALQSNVTGNNNTAGGAFVLQSNTTGNNNTAGGANAMQSNTTGCCNTALGQAALNSNANGSSNSAIGGSALQNNTSGNGNTAIGQVALFANTIGNGNTASGQNALQNNTTGSNNAAFGANANVATNNLNNATAIGANAVVDASDHVRVGDTNVTQIGGQVAWSNLSDRREKKDIRALSQGLEFVLALRPVEYRMRNGSERIDFGFIAQEVETLVGTNYNVLGIGGTAERKLSLRYTDFVAPMVKAIQQQQALIDAQRAQIAGQQARLDGQEREFAELRIANARELAALRAENAAENAEVRRAVAILLARTAAEGKLAAR